MNYEEWKRDQEIRRRELKLSGIETSKSIIMSDLIRNCNETQRFDCTKEHTEPVPMKECPKCKGKGTGEIERKKESLLEIMSRALQKEWTIAPEYNEDTVQRLIIATLRILDRKVTKGNMINTLARMFCIQRKDSMLIQNAFVKLLKNNVITCDMEKCVTLKHPPIQLVGVDESSGIDQTVYNKIRIHRKRRTKKKYEMSNEEVHIKRGKRQKIKYQMKQGDLT